MAGAQSFLDNLENLRIVLSVALEHTQTNGNEFVVDADGGQMGQCERSIEQIRILAERLEREFSHLEGVISTVRLIRLHESLP
jgi:hypothetical protein